LIAYAAKYGKVKLDPSAFTVGFGRRATAYKRADLIFRDIDRLKQIASGAGPFQIVFAGKAHPRDDPGKKLIQQVFEAAKSSLPMCASPICPITTSMWRRSSFPAWTCGSIRRSRLTRHRGQAG